MNGERSDSRLTRELVDWFAGDSRERGPRALVLVAHPDDETIGAGARLAELDPCAIVIVTDGAPADPYFMRRGGCSDRAGYAALRRRELQAALHTGGVPAERVRAWRVVDQCAAFELEALAAAVRGVFDALRPEVVLTHPYEGGHPDHDATAFAAHAAVRLQSPASRPALLELGYYHEGPHGVVWGRFAGDPGRAAPLRGEPLARKRAMLACYRSQAEVLGHFPLDAERVRAAPAYDFSRPPPSGAFHYDAFRWPLRGADFVRSAGAAWERLRD